MRKSAIVGLIFLITFLFDFAIITETNENKQENNYNNKKWKQQNQAVANHMRKASFITFDKLALLFLFSSPENPSEYFYWPEYWL